MPRMPRTKPCTQFHTKGVLRGPVRHTVKNSQIWKGLRGAVVIGANFVVWLPTSATGTVTEASWIVTPLPLTLSCTLVPCTCSVYANWRGAGLLLLLLSSLLFCRLSTKLNVALAEAVATTKSAVGPSRSFPTGPDAIRFSNVVGGLNTTQLAAPTANPSDTANRRTAILLVRFCKVDVDVACVKSPDVDWFYIPVDESVQKCIQDCDLRPSRRQAEHRHKHQYIQEHLPSFDQLCLEEHTQHTVIAS